MTALMLVPVATSIVLGLTGARLGRWLPPSTGVRLLGIASVATALSTGFVLSVAAFMAIAQVPAVAVLGRWSVGTVAGGDPVPLALGILAGSVAVALLAAGLRRVFTAAGDLMVAEVACRRLGPGAQGLVVVNDVVPDAYALPGLAGRVVVSTSMLRALPVEERRVLLAHEAAHLRHQHHLYVQLAELGAAANPMMRPLAVAVRTGVERWADEDAAAVVGSRELTARALARASLARHQSPERRQPFRAALAAADSTVVARTRALLAGPPRPRRALAAATAALMLAGVAAAVLTGHEVEHRFEAAQSAYESR